MFVAHSSNDLSSTLGIIVETCLCFHTPRNSILSLTFLAKSWRRPHFFQPFKHTLHPSSISPFQIPPCWILLSAWKMNSPFSVSRSSLEIFIHPSFSPVLNTVYHKSESWCLHQHYSFSEFLLKIWISHTGYIIHVFGTFSSPPTLVYSGVPVWFT